VKQKLDRRATAKELYRSPLWRRRREYAERSRRPWFVLSALHGLVAPDELIDPYNVALRDFSPDERARWGERVAADLERRVGSLEGGLFEVHAGEVYRRALEAPLRSRGASFVVPLAGLGIGQQLAWYAHREPTLATIERRRVATAEEVAAALHNLDGSPARVRASAWPGDLAGLEFPGVYSWWADKEGAADLSAGLQAHVAPGRIYAGQTGATKWPSGKVGRATLKTRIGDNHLRGTVRGSTFRLTFAAALARALKLKVVGPKRLNADSERRLSDWMRSHLDVAVHAFAGADALADLEHRVLAVLDPPLNLDGMPRTPLRDNLSLLRAKVSHGDAVGSGEHSEQQPPARRVEQ
jgi:hypothetical protein